LIFKKDKCFELAPLPIRTECEDTNFL